LVLVREGSEFRVYVDGTKIGSGTDSSALHYYDAVGTFNIGMVDSGYYMNGYLDEVKLSVGIARYNQDFTAPTRPEDDFKIEGTLSEAAKLYLIDEDTDVLERMGSFNAGTYEFIYVSSGRKFVAGRKDSDGEGKAFGDLVPVTLSGSEIFVDRFTGTNNTAPNSTYWTRSNTKTFIYGNKLRQSMTNDDIKVTYKTTLTGNFEIELDQQIISDTTSTWSHSTIFIVQQSTSYQFRIMRVHDDSGTKYRFLYHDTSDHYTDVSATATSNKYKVTRFGNTIHLYYWNGSTWVAPRTFTEDASGNMRIELVTASNATIVVDWDNFVRYAVL